MSASATLEHRRGLLRIAPREQVEVPALAQLQRMAEDTVHVLRTMADGGLPSSLRFVEVRLPNGRRIRLTVGAELLAETPDGRA